MSRARLVRRPLLETLERRDLLAADIAPFAMGGWPGPVYVSNALNTVDNTPGLLDTDKIYIGGGLTNVGDTDVTKPFVYKFLIDNIVRVTFNYSVVQNGPLGFGDAVAPSKLYIGNLRPGQHTFKLVLDATNAIAESDETNNSFEYQFTVGASEVTNVAFIKQPKAVVAGVSMAPITVKATNAFRNNVPGDTVTLSVVSGPGAITGTTSVVTGADGVATFNNISFTVAGTYVLKATDGAIASLNSASFKVKPAALATLTFDHALGSVFAGDTFNQPIAVKATDAFGNVLSGKQIKLAVETGPVGAKIFGTVAAVTDATGIAKFKTTSFQKAGAYTLKASNLLKGILTTATSDSFAVRPGSRAKVVFLTLPVGATHGQPTTLTADSEDKYGNRITGLSILQMDITTSKTPPGGFLTGTLSEDVVDGVATFDNLVFTAAGKYSVLIELGLQHTISAVFTVL